MKNLFAFLLLTAAACGGTSSSTSSPSPSSSSSSSSDPADGPAAGSSCEATGTLICQRACACSTDGKCHVGVALDGGAVASIDYDDEKACRDLYVTLGCANGGDPSFDYGACRDRLAGATCVASAGGQAIELPIECHVP